MSLLLFVSSFTGTTLLWLTATSTVLAFSSTTHRICDPTTPLSCCWATSISPSRRVPTSHRWPLTVQPRAPPGRSGTPSTSSRLSTTCTTWVRNCNTGLSAYQPVLPLSLVSCHSRKRGKNKDMNKWNQEIKERMTKWSNERTIESLDESMAHELFN